MVRNRLHIIWTLSLLLVVSLAACDSGSDGDPIPADDASELFFGVWNLTGASDDSGDRTAELAQNYAGITAEFETDTTFVFNWDASTEQAVDATLMGTFKATESSSLLRLQTGEVDQSLTFSYAFSVLDSTDFELTSTATQTQLMNSALGTSFSGPTTLMFTLLEQ